MKQLFCFFYLYIVKVIFIFILEFNKYCVFLQF